MLKIEHNISLKPYNTFDIDAYTKYLVRVKNVQDIRKICIASKLLKNKCFILGGGANVLFTKDFDGLVVKIEILGRRVLVENKDCALVEVGAGENWHDFVTWCVENNWHGVENLALIPGTAGAAPVQNIGAYGQKLADTLHSLEAVCLKTGGIKNFSKEECQFGYRTSIFKKKAKDKFVITKIRLKLQKQAPLETAYSSRYDSIERELNNFAQPPYTLQNIYDAVCNIRRAKLPQVGEVGSAGSFFKNPVVHITKLKAVEKIAPGVQTYPAEKEDYVKVAAGWLLEELGWKGKRLGGCGIWHKHALILVNHGNASPQEIIELIREIQNDFFNKYQLQLEPEVCII